MLIYRITNKINGKVYIGKTTKTLDWRWRLHQKHAHAGSQIYLHRAIRKHGADAFTAEEICSAHTVDELDALETRFILSHQSYIPEKGYNGTLGGDGTGLLTEETRQRMRDAKTPEIRRRMSEARKGKKLPEEYCRAIGDSKRGAKNPWFGKKRPEVVAAMRAALPRVVSEETRQKQRLAKLGRTNKTAGLKWVHKNNERKRIKSGEVDFYLGLGWQLGNNVHNHWSEEERQRIGSQHQGKKLSSAHRTKISAGLEGHAVSKETRQKISSRWTPERRAAQATRTAEMNKKKVAAHAG